MSPEAFFAYARTRHSVYLQRMEGLPPPWTNDPVISKVRFTNVFRELDRVTLWFKDNIRQPLAHDPWVVPATIIFRWFNRIETGEVIAPYLKAMADVSADGRKVMLDYAEKAVREALPKGPWVTGSYMVCSGFNTGDKLAGMMRFSQLMLDWWAQEGFALFFRGEADRWVPSLNLQQAHESLVKVEGLAGFTAYEVVTDLRFTDAVRDDDAMLWAHAGPGAARGGSRVMGRDVDHLKQHSKADQLILNALMRELLDMSRSERYWPQEQSDWPKWEMRDVEHTLCEFDKYERVRRMQGRNKRGFNPVGALPLPGAAIKDN